MPVIEDAKRKVWRSLDNGCSILSDLEGDMDEAITYLKDLKAKYKNMKLRLDVVHEYEYTALIVLYEDVETDEEYNRRVQGDIRRKQAIEADERKMLAMLKKKYEGVPKNDDH